MKLKTLIENLKFYKSKGSKQVTLDIDELLTAVNIEIKEINQRSMAFEVDGGLFEIQNGEYNKRYEFNTNALWYRC